MQMDEICQEKKYSEIDQKGKAANKEIPDHLMKKIIRPAFKNAYDSGMN